MPVPVTQLLRTLFRSAGKPLTTEMIRARLKGEVAPDLIDDTLRRLKRQKDVVCKNGTRGAVTLWTATAKFLAKADAKIDATKKPNPRTGRRAYGRKTETGHNDHYRNDRAEREARMMGRAAILSGYLRGT